MVFDDELVPFTVIFLLGENYQNLKKGPGTWNSLRTDRPHWKLCRDFWKKLLKCIFGCPKLQLGPKKLRKIISKIFTFHRGDPYDFSQIISKGIFCLSKFLLGTSKNTLEFFEKYPHNLELSILFIRP